MDRIRNLAIKLLEDLKFYPYDEEDIDKVLGYLYLSQFLKENEFDPYAKFFENLYR